MHHFQFRPVAVIQYINLMAFLSIQFVNKIACQSPVELDILVVGCHLNRVAE